MKETDTKTLAIITIFAALTIGLNFSIKIPAPYAPFLIYQIWEIPIVAAFLLYGTRVGVLITVINTLVLIVVYPGALPTGPLYNLAAVLSMLLGIGLAKALAKRRSSRDDAVLATSLTASGVLLRIMLMTFVNWAFLRFPPPVGYGLPEGAIIAYIPAIIAFNFSLALYTIPFGYAIARGVKSYIKMTM